MVIADIMQFLVLQISAFNIIAALISLNYASLIIAFIYGLSRLYKNTGSSTLINKIDTESRPVIVSVLIAARNEEENIGNCIDSLKRQDYPGDLFEVIIINDQSTDATVAIIDEKINSSGINLIQLHTSGNGGKKASIHEGLKAAKGDIILTTDADCIVPSGWISSFCKRFNNTGAKYITGPVMFFKDEQLFNHIQCLEFNSLIASTAGAIGIGMPVMSNGANMGIRREVIEDFLNGNFTIDELLNTGLDSGDDVFVMQNIKKNYTASAITFLDDPSAIVHTYANKTLSGFIRQRLRWVSKSKGYKDKGVIYTAASIFTFNFIVLLSFFIDFYPGLYLFVVKCILDYILIHKYCSKYGQRELVNLIPLAEPFIILYTVGIGITGNFAGYSWKGRKKK